MNIPLYECDQNYYEYVYWFIICEYTVKWKIIIFILLSLLFPLKERRMKQGETEYYKITMESLNMEAASKVSEEEKIMWTVINVHAITFCVIRRVNPLCWSFFVQPSEENYWCVCIPSVRVSSSHLTYSSHF